jgi:hypothetical protein
MVDYFIRVISKRPSTTRYQWLYKIVQCIVKREPTNNRVLRIWVQSAIKGRKNRNYQIPACVRHLWRGRLSQKPTYHDLASLVRFAFYNRRITYRGLYLFTWSVLNENKSQVISGHTDFWKKYAGVRSQYVSGLEPNRKFLILTGTKKIVLGDRITQFTSLSTNHYWFYDQSNKAIRWLGRYNLRLGVVGGLRDGARVRLVRGNRVRRQDMFIYSASDMKFHSYVKKDLCITFRNPNSNGERMTLGRCDCQHGNARAQELLVKYFRYEKNNGFEPYRVFSLRSKTNSRMALKISNDGSLLLPSQRYAKVAYGARNSDDERFYWDPSTKCLRNYLHREGCIGSVQQGCATQMITLGQSGDAGRTCTEVKFDGTFLWINGKVAQPQSGYTNTNNMHVSLNELSGAPAQRWVMSKTNIDARRSRSRSSPGKADSTFGWQRGYFEIRASNGYVVHVQSNGRVSLRRRNGATDQQFFFDQRTKTITSRRYRNLSLASKSAGSNRYRLIARRTQRTSPELFTRPGTRGVIQMAANKNFVWRSNGSSVEIIRGNGRYNRNPTYFTTVTRG